ncbi:MAG: hypothetical protein HZA77_03595 [Candidatus Schekmanbacteria bacterium]|nr:hypothetical protein [Candidatus Schekmanbacteria bacterium]
MKLKKIPFLFSIILAAVVFGFFQPVFAGDSNSQSERSNKGVLTYLIVSDMTSTDQGDNGAGSIDIVRNLDCTGDGSTTTTDKEQFADFKVTMTIKNQGHPNYPDPTNHDVQITSVEVTAKKMGGAAKKSLTPKIKFSKISSGGIIPQDGSLDLTLTIFSKSQKEIIYNRYAQKYFSKFGSTSVPSPYLRYKIKIKVKGKEIPYGNKVDTEVELPVTLADVDNCSS